MALTLFEVSSRSMRWGREVRSITPKRTRLPSAVSFLKMPYSSMPGQLRIVCACERGQEERGLTEKEMSGGEAGANASERGESDA